MIVQTLGLVIFKRPSFLSLWHTSSTLHSTMSTASLLLHAEHVFMSHAGLHNLPQSHGAVPGPLVAGLPTLPSNGLRSMEAFLRRWAPMLTTRPPQQCAAHLPSWEPCPTCMLGVHCALLNTSACAAGSAQEWSPQPAANCQTCSPKRPFLALPRFLSWGWQRSSACPAPQHSGQQCQQLAAPGPGRHCCSLGVHTCT